MGKSSAGKILPPEQIIENCFIFGFRSGDMNVINRKNRF